MCFLKVPLACLGSMTAAVQPYSLWNSQKHITKPVLQVADPECSCLHEQALAPIAAFQHSNQQATTCDWMGVSLFIYPRHCYVSYVIYLQIKTGWQRRKIVMTWKQTTNPDAFVQSLAQLPGESSSERSPKAKQGHYSVSLVKVASCNTIWTLIDVGVC